MSLNIKNTDRGENGLANTLARVSAAAILFGGLITLPFINRATASEATTCPAESVSRSISGKVVTKVVFRNKSSKTVKTYWLDYSGKRKFYKQLDPGKGYTQSTYVTHPWVITDASDNCLGVYYPDGQIRTVEIK